MYIKNCYTHSFLVLLIILVILNFECKYSLQLFQKLNLKPCAFDYYNFRGCTMQYYSVLLSVLFLINQSEAHLLKKLYQDTETLLSAPVGADVGERLILTPLLKEGRIEEAQEAALVNSIAFEGVISYSAYFTVDEAFDSNIYFWFFPSAGI